MPKDIGMGENSYFGSLYIQTIFFTLRGWGVYYG